MCRGAGGVAKAEKIAPALRPAFDVLDADRDGKIRLSSRDLPVPVMDVLEVRACLQLKRSDSRGYGYEVVEEAFKVMDGDGDGKVGCDDLRRCLQIAGLEVARKRF